MYVTMVEEPGTMEESVDLEKVGVNLSAKRLVFIQYTTAKR